jgi:hypothetical protein
MLAVSILLRTDGRIAGWGVRSILLTACREFAGAANTRLATSVAAMSANELITPTAWMTSQSSRTFGI